MNPLGGVAKAGIVFRSLPALRADKIRDAAANMDSPLPELHKAILSTASGVLNI
jgi:hypothetical protein